MRLRVLVEDHGVWRDLLLSVGAGQTVADLTTAVAAHLGHHGATGLRRGDPPGPELDPTAAVGDSGLRWGDRITLTSGDATPTARVPQVPLRRLVTTAGPDAGRTLALSPGSHTLGRAAEADLTIGDPHLSRLHLRVDVEATGVRVADLDSSNGTRLDAEVVGSTPVPLTTDGTLMAGSSLLRLLPPPPRQPNLPAREGTVAFTRRPRLEPPLPEPTVQLHDDTDGVGVAGAFRGLLGRRRGSSRDGDERAAAARRARQHALHPDPTTLVERARFVRPELWERRPLHEDFLHVRIGWASADGDGDMPLPVVVDLRTVGSLGVCCDDDRMRSGILRWQLAQLAGLCSPAELRLAAFGAPLDWAWTTWLPHAGAMVTTTDGRGTEDGLEQLLEEVRGGRARRPALVAVIDDSVGVDPATVQALVAEGPAAGVHPILAGRAAHTLPRVGATFTVDPTTGRGHCPQSVDGPAAVDGVDGVRPRTALDLARATAGVRDVTSGGAGPSSVPPAVSLVDLLEVTDPHPRRITEWWTSGDQPVVVGASADDVVQVEVDRGSPHVLLAGDRPAARHALLRALAAAAAALRSPARLQLVLAGGSIRGEVFGACLELPHVGAHGADAEDRLHDWLRGELERRRADPRPFGVPQLLVLVDDVVELDAVQPGLLTTLEEIAGAEADAGITLVLGTQHPRGLPEALRQRLTARIALRMADAADSRAVLGSTDATNLPVDAPGRAWLRRGDTTRAFQTAGVDGVTSARGGADAIEVRDVVAGRAVSTRSTTTSVHQPAPSDSDLALLVEACRSAAPVATDAVGSAAGTAGVDPVTVERTLLFSDVVRSTALIEAIGDEHWTRLVQWHDQAVAGLVEAHGGEVVDHTGDGFFVAFTQPLPALECSIEIQRMLQRHRREAGFAPEVRIGLHHAEVHFDGRYRGRGVHVAARIAALAEGGEVLVSGATLAHAPDIPVGPTRTAELRGVSTPVPVASLRITS